MTEDINVVSAELAHEAEKRIEAKESRIYEAEKRIEAKELRIYEAEKRMVAKEGRMVLISVVTVCLSGLVFAYGQATCG